MLASTAATTATVAVFVVVVPLSALLVAVSYHVRRGRGSGVEIPSDTEKHAANRLSQRNLPEVERAVRRGEAVADKQSAAAAMEFALVRGSQLETAKVAALGSVVPSLIGLSIAAV